MATVRNTEERVTNPGLVRELTIKTMASPTAEAQVFRAKFDADEVATLEAFQREADRLQSTRLVRGGTSVGMSMSWKEGAGVTIESRLPDEDDIAALLHRLRPFMLQKERTNFLKVANLLSKKYESDGIRSVIKDLRDEYSCKRQVAAWRLTFNGVLANDDDMFDAWLNSVEYHRDEDGKLDRYQAMSAFGDPSATRGLFVSIAVMRTHVILRFAGMLDMLLMTQPDGKSLTFIFQPKATNDAEQANATTDQ